MENDITSQFIVDDQSTATLRKIDAVSDKTAKAMSKGADDAGFNFGNLAVKLLKSSEAFKELQQFTGQFVDFAVSSAFDVVASGVDRLGLSLSNFTEFFRDFAFAAESKKIIDQYNEMNRALQRIIEGTAKVGQEEFAAFKSIFEGLADSSDRLNRVEFLSRALEISPDVAKKIVDLSIKNVNDALKNADHVVIVPDVVNQFDFDAENETIRRTMQSFRDRHGRELFEAYDDIGANAARGFADGFNDAAASLVDLESVGADVARSIGSSFSDFFFDAFETRTLRIQDLLRSLASSVLRIISNQIGGQITSAIGSAFGGGSAPIVAGGISGSAGVGAIAAAPSIVNLNVSTIDATSFDGYLANRESTLVAIMQKAIGSRPSMRSAFGL